MAAQITSYKCPACTGPLHFDGASGKLTCDYCGSSFTVEEIEQKYGKKNEEAEKNFHEAEEKKAKEKEKLLSEGWDASEIDSWGPGEGLKAYSCTSCGAELICDETTAATECPYCGNPTIIPGQFSGALKPDFVIPFKLDKKAAIAGLKNHYKGKKLLPNVFTEQNHVEKIQGVYVPFWLYNGTASADADFHGEKVYSRIEGKYEVTETHHYDLTRSGRVDFENIPVDASSKMEDALMDSIEPYDYSELKPFSMSYLPGFLADKYDVDAQACAERADTRAENSVVAALRATADGYGVVVEKSRSVQLRRGKVHYALMPVWLLNTKWNGQNFVFAMNGQTGKMVGDLPMDKKKYWMYRLMYTGIIAAVLTAMTGILFML